MVRLWERMRSAFGQRWVREYGEVNGAAYEDWRDVLGPLSLNQLKQGLQATLESGSAHPPNLSEFTKACMVTKRSGVKPENQKYLESKKQTRMPPNVQAEQRKVSRKSTDRDASFCDSYYALGLHTRWGKLDPEKEREWRSRG